MKSAAILVVVAVCAAALFAAAAAAGPTIPSQYKAAATITLPYRNVYESVVCYFDGESNMQKLVYNGGQDTYIYRADMGMTWTVVPVVTELGCFATPGAVTLTSIIPDLTPFNLIGKETIDGKLCDHYQYVNTVEQKVNTYNFYMYGAEPVQYHWLGYDTLLGSHYDEYVVQYTAWDTSSGAVNASDFAKPDMTCGSFPDDDGDSTSADDPLASLQELFSTPAVLPQEGTPAFRILAARFNRNYESSKTQTRAFYEFVKNDRMVKMHNRARRHVDDARFQLNQYFDWSPEDMSRVRGRKNSQAKPTIAPARVHRATGGPLPKSVDWREHGAVTPVKDQGICGSCWSFGTTGTIEGTLFRTTGKLIELSQQELVDCSWPQKNTGCDGGEDKFAYEWILSNGGLAAAADYGRYQMLDGWCHAKKTPVTAKLSNYVLVDRYNETALMDALANHGPISISIDAALNTFSFYSDGVYFDPACGSAPADLDHTVLAVGYGTTDAGSDYWIVKNSWSVHWGDDGYIKMSRKNNNCGVATVPTYVEM